jgi:hypothetical protein
MYRKIEKNISKNSPSRTHQTDKISNCTESVQLKNVKKKYLYGFRTDTFF